MHVEQGKAGFDPSDPRSLVAIADQQREEELAKKNVEYDTSVGIWCDYI